MMMVEEQMKAVGLLPHLEDAGLLPDISLFRMPSFENSNLRIYFENHIASGLYQWIVVQIMSTLYFGLLLTVWMNSRPSTTSSSHGRELVDQTDNYHLDSLSVWNYCKSHGQMCLPMSGEIREVSALRTSSGDIVLIIL